MGYRSTVYVKIPMEDQQEFEELLKQHRLTECFQLAKGDCTDKYTRYVGYDLKWYDGYEDVDAINDFINADLEDRLRGMIAIGEDGRGTEYGEPWEIDMYTVTSVEW